MLKFDESKKNVLDEAMVDALLESSSSPDFLARATTLMRQNQGGFSFTTFAKKAGFASRSYARMCLLGQRPVTMQSLPKLIKGLGLNRDAAKYFSLLVQNTTPAELQFLKLKILEKRAAKMARFNKPEVYRNRLWPILYAALGDTERGASLDEICARTKLKHIQVTSGLKDLEDLGAIKKNLEAMRYIPLNPHILIEKMGSETAYHDYFLWSLQNLAAAAKKNFDRQDHMFLSSTFSIQSTRLESVKREMQEMIRNKIVDLEHVEGEEIVTLTMGIVPQMPLDQRASRD